MAPVWVLAREERAGERKKTTMKKTDGTTREGTIAWLRAKGRRGIARIEALSWGRLARLYNANRPGSAVRRAINAEARRLGYTPWVILWING